MAIRMTGMMSNLDTDTIIKELMSAQSLKKTKIEGKKTKLEWTMDKWKDLNAKIYGLYTGTLNKVKTVGNYSAKKVSSSNEALVSAKGSKDAAPGAHTIDVTKLASGQKVTGEALTTSVSNSTKLSDLGFTNGETIKVSAGSGSEAVNVSLTVGGSTTVKDFLKTLESAGLNASFDEGQQRFFISSKNSGKDSSFSITSVNEDSSISSAKNALSSAVGSDSESVLNSFYNDYDKAKKNVTDKKDYYDSVMASSGSSNEEKIKAYDEWKQAEKGVKDLEDNLVSYAEEKLKGTISKDARDKVISDYVDALKADPSSPNHKAIIDAVDKMYYEYDSDGNKVSPPKYSTETLDAAEASIETRLKEQAVTNINNLIAAGTIYADEEAKQQAITNEYNSLYNTEIAAAGSLAAAKNKEADKMYNSSKESAFQSAGQNYADSAAGQTDINNIINNASNQALITQKVNDVRTQIAQYESAISAAPTSTMTNSLSKLGLGNIVTKADGTLDTGVPGNNGAIHFEAASDAEVKFDGVPLTSSSNNFTAAGITFDIKGDTIGTGPITLNVTNNAEDSYDMIKDFVKQYNEVLTEMSTAYYASSSKGYEPLTSEQKKAMSEDDIKNWNQKIQDSLLRRDDTLGNLMNTFRTALQTSVTVDGKQYSLASFGITTSDDWTERGLLHIRGDKDDTYMPSATNKLQKALEEDPELVGKIISGITNNLYETMQKKMSTSTLSSALKFYNDKQMSKQVDEYKKEIKTWEEKLKDMEDRYYKQFSAMETALARLNSQSSALAGLMGS